MLYFRIYDYSFQLTSAVYNTLYGLVYYGLLIGENALPGEYIKRVKCVVYIIIIFFKVENTFNLEIAYWYKPPYTNARCVVFKSLYKPLLLDYIVCVATKNS